MQDTPLWLTEADVTSSIDLGGAIEALEEALRAEATGQADSMNKTHLMVGDNNAMHAIGGALHRAGICGVKNWVNINGKSATLLNVYSLEDGRVLAVIEATALGQLRTAAMTGLGTKWMAAADVSEMTIIGTGKQALPQVAACAAVRPIKTVRVFSRTPEKRAALCALISQELTGLETVDCGSLEEAVEDVALITLCTNATEPFFFSRHAMAGAHINAVGAIVPKRVEFGDDLFPRCTDIAVDSVAGVQAMSREFIDYFGAGQSDWDRVQPLSARIGEEAVRTANADLTLFKAVGMGLSDLAVANRVLSICSKSGAGHNLPARNRKPLPLQAAE